MLFSYKGLDKGGKALSGSVDAASMREARARLRAKGIFLTEIKEEKPALLKGGLFASVGRGVPQKEMASFMRQMASLTTAGIPLMEALEAARQQTESSVMKKVVHSLKDSVRQGESLAGAMEKAGGHFDRLTVSMVRAGETGGHLAKVLTEIADYGEETLRRESAIKSATVYPAVMGILGVALILFLLAYVVPKITVIFEDMEQSLPLSTRILIALTDVLVKHGFVMGALLCLSLIALSRFLKTEKGKRMVDGLAIRLWVFGPVVRASVLARWSHTSSVLLLAGVPLLQTLRLSRDVTQNSRFADAIDKSIEDIREGVGIADSLKKSKLFPPVVIQMVAAGEKSGQAGSLLGQVAKDQSAELENRISVLMSLVHPALIVIMGLAVGFIVMAILLPIFEISQLIG